VIEHTSRWEVQGNAGDSRAKSQQALPPIVSQDQVLAVEHFLFSVTPAQSSQFT
jgi:hypothetical protein